MPAQAVPSAHISFAQRDEQTRALLAEAQRVHPPDAGTREKAVLLNRPLAQALARQYRGRGIEDDDLEQVAMLGLCKAVRGYQGGLKETSFAGFAVPTITGELKRHFRDSGWLVRPTRSLQEVGQQVRTAIPGLTQRLQRQPSTTDLADSLGLPAATINDALLAQGLYHGRSLDAPVGGTATALAETLPDARDAFAPVDAALTVGPAVEQLSGRDRTVLRLRYLENLNQEEIGQLIGVSQMQVSRLLTQILAKLRNLIENPRAA